MELPKILILFVFLLIILAFFIRNTRMMNKYVIIGLIIIITLGVIFSDPLYRIISRKVLQYVQSPIALQLPFISEKWKSADPYDPNDHTRQRMSADLLMHHKPTGNSRSDIINMLGKPDTTKYFPEWDFEYYLGPAERRNRVGSEWLVIKFDEEDVVNNYAVVNK